MTRRRRIYRCYYAIFAILFVGVTIARLSQIRIMLIARHISCVVNCISTDRIRFRTHTRNRIDIANVVFLLSTNDNDIFNDKLRRATRIVHEYVAITVAITCTCIFLVSPVQSFPLATLEMMTDSIVRRVQQILQIKNNAYRTNKIYIHTRVYTNQIILSHSTVTFRCLVVNLLRWQLVRGP